MKTRFSVFLVATIATAFFLHGQNIKDAVTNAGFVATKILDSQVVDMGNRTITYNRIETPLLKPQPTIEIAPVEAPAEYVPSEQELAEMRRMESLRYESLGGAATVYRGQGTEFRFWTASGEVVALSSIDFNFLNNIWDFEREGVYYSIFIFASEFGPAELAEAQSAGWISWSQFPAETGGISHFVVISAPQDEEGKRAIESLENLHAHFDENRKALFAAYEESEKARIALEEWDKAHPPQPVSTTVTYFPIRSSRHTAADEADAMEAKK